jgi:hypothetical protein
MAALVFAGCFLDERARIAQSPSCFCSCVRVAPATSMQFAEEIPMVIVKLGHRTLGVIDGQAPAN